MMKKCELCGLDYQPSARTAKRQKYCSRECQRASRKQRISKVCVTCQGAFIGNSVKLYCSAQCLVKATKLRQNYGLTMDEHRSMHIRAENRCEACGDVGPLVVDHCHATGRVRGLLCVNCNIAEGMLRGDASRARALADYIERSAA